MVDDNDRSILKAWARGEFDSALQRIRGAKPASGASDDKAAADASPSGRPRMLNRT